MPRSVRRKKTSARPLQVDLRRFIRRGERFLDGEAGGVVSDFYAIARAISSEGFDKGLQNVMKCLESRSPGIELAAAFAEHLTHEISGLNADILQKSIQETILDVAGLGSDPEQLNVKIALEKFLRRRGANRLLELFLLNYVFNAVWIRIQEPVRSKTGSESLSKSMMRVKRLCASVMKSILADWQAEGKLEGLAGKKRMGSTLMQTIEARLLGEA
jgi:hypothetical protein